MSDTDTSVQFQIQYYGTKGDESFDIYLFGKKIEFKDIGTSQSNFTKRVTGPIGPLILQLHNAGKRDDLKCRTTPDTRWCRSSRRGWGKTRRRCGGRAPYKICTGEDWTRSVVIKKLTLNGSDIKDYFVRTADSCNPDSGGVTKRESITGGIIDVAGKYVIKQTDIFNNALGSFVPKPEFDEVTNDLGTSQSAYNASNKALTKLKGNHGVLTYKYNELLNRTGLIDNGVKSQKNTMINQQNKLKSANALASSTDGQIKILKGAIYNTREVTNAANKNYTSEQKRRFENTEKENTNINKENKDRTQINDTFKKKTYYEQETTTIFNNYNYIMFYIYMFLVFSTIVMFLFKDSKDFDKFQNNIWYSVAFFLLIFLFPFYIYKFEIKLFNILNYIYKSPFFPSFGFNGDLY
jgi:hypothetical protein